MPGKSLIDLAESDLVAIGKVLWHGVPGRPAFVFGSRVTGLARPDSDLDLAIGGDRPLTLSERGEMKDEFEKLGLNFKIDVIDLYDARGIFRQRIEAEWIPWEQVLSAHTEAAA